jgi:hypothetical protein
VAGIRIRTDSHDWNAVYGLRSGSAWNGLFVFFCSHLYGRNIFFMIKEKLIFVMMVFNDIVERVHSCSVLSEVALKVQRSPPGPGWTQPDYAPVINNRLREKIWWSVMIIYVGVGGPLAQPPHLRHRPKRGIFIGWGGGELVGHAGLVGGEGGQQAYSCTRTHTVHAHQRRPGHAHTSTPPATLGRICCEANGGSSHIYSRYTFPAPHSSLPSRGQMREGGGV